MKLKDAKAIFDMLTERGEEVELHEEYSPRGGFGKTTAAVSGDQLVVAWAGGVLGIEPWSWNSDSLGLNSVVY